MTDSLSLASSLSSPSSLCFILNLRKTEACGGSDGGVRGTQQIEERQSAFKNKSQLQAFSQSHETRRKKHRRGKGRKEWRWAASRGCCPGGWSLKVAEGRTSDAHPSWPPLPCSSSTLKSQTPPDEHTVVLLPC